MKTNDNLPIKPSDEGRQTACYVIATITGIILGIMTGSIVWSAGIVHDVPAPGLIIMAFVAGLSGMVIKEVFAKKIPHIQVFMICLGAVIFVILLHIFCLQTAASEYIPEELFYLDI